MTAGVSASSFIAVGLALPNPYNETKPKYFGADLI